MLGCDSLLRAKSQEPRAKSQEPRAKSYFRVKGVGRRAEGIVLADESFCCSSHCEQSIDCVVIHNNTPFCKGGCQAKPDRGIFSNNSNHSNYLNNFYYSKLSHQILHSADFGGLFFANHI